MAQHQGSGQAAASPRAPNSSVPQAPAAKQASPAVLAVAPHALHGPLSAAASSNGSPIGSAAGSSPQAAGQKERLRKQMLRGAPPNAALSGQQWTAHPLCSPPPPTPPQQPASRVFTHSPKDLVSGHFLTWLLWSFESFFHSFIRLLHPVLQISVPHVLPYPLCPTPLRALLHAPGSAPPVSSVSALPVRGKHH